MDTKELTVDGVVNDEGSIVVLSGLDSEGTCFWFACDHRPARDIIDALIDGNAPTVEVEAWQLV